MNANRVQQALADAPFDTAPVPIKRPEQPAPAQSAAGPIPPPTMFPLDVFPNYIADSFRTLSRQHNIPPDFMGLTALFTVGALAGNVYRGDLNGGVKPIVYACLVGPSGVGKTPPYKHLFENITQQMRAQTHANYKTELKGWEERREAAKTAKQPFTEDKPIKRVRMITDGTLEAITKFAEQCPAGFGVVYDEGGRFFSGANAYKKDTSSVDFWNEFWNGGGYEIVRVDSERDRHVTTSATSVLIGMQRDRLLKYFTEDTIASGLLNRFLICESDYILLNESVDVWAEKVQACDQWQDIVQYLYTKGMQFVANTEIRVGFEQAAKIHYSACAAAMVQAANRAIIAAKKDDSSRLMIAYQSKQAAYLSRLALILAIIDDPRDPLIRYHNVDNAKRLLDFFAGVAAKLLFQINETAQTGLTESEQKLLDTLPVKFTSAEAQMVCEELGLSRKYFSTKFIRKYSHGYVRKTEKGWYEKM